jgi:hypothetical protein
MMPKSKRDYKKEYETYQKHRTKYRSELNGERRRRGIYGKGGGDVPHVDKDGDGELEKGEYGKVTSAKKNRGKDRIRDMSKGIKYRAKKKIVSKLKKKRG